MDNLVFTLNQKATHSLIQIAKDLGISESEVLRKGLTIMGLFTEIEKGKPLKILLKEREGIRQLII